MSENKKSPLDKEPAEGSRETVDRQLEKQERESRRKPHRSGRPQGSEAERPLAKDREQRGRS